jgi:hypothetical protein
MTSVTRAERVVDINYCPGRMIFKVTLTRKFGKTANIFSDEETEHWNWKY